MQSFISFYPHDFYCRDKQIPEISEIKVTMAPNIKVGMDFRPTVTKITPAKMPSPQNRTFLGKLFNILTWGSCMMRDTKHDVDKSQF